MRGLSDQLEYSKDVIGHKQIELAKLTEHFKTLSNATAMWQVCDNMNISISINQPNILEFGNDNSKSSFAQSFLYLESRKSFKIQILNARGIIGIGLTRKGHPIDEIPGFHEGFGYSSIGLLDVRRKSEKVGTKWKVGDIIECGIEFPWMNIDESDITGNIAEICVLRNGQLITKTQVEMPDDGFFPTVYMDSAGAKVLYFGIGTLESNFLALGILKMKYIDLK